MAVRGIRILHAGGPADDRTRDRRVRSGLVAGRCAGTRPILTIAPILADILPAELLRPRSFATAFMASFSLMPTTFVEPVLPDTACADDWPPWGSFTFMEPLYR